MASIPENFLISIENWKRRTEIVEYCVGVVDQSMDEKRKVLETQQSDAATQRRIQGALFAEEVKVPSYPHIPLGSA